MWFISDLKNHHLRPRFQCLGEISRDRWDRWDRGFAFSNSLRAFSFLVARPRKGLQARPRPEAKLDYLPYEQHEKLCEWLLTHGVRYSEIKARLKRSYGINTNTSAIGQFYKNHVVQHLAAIRARAVNVAAGYIHETQQNPAEFTAATADALEAKAMQVALDPHTDARELKIYLELVCRWQELKLRAQEVLIQQKKLKLLEKKQRKLEAVLVADSTLTPDEIANRCRMIFKANGKDAEHYLPQKAERLAEPVFDAADAP
jgi:hypothetical protein